MPGCGRKFAISHATSHAIETAIAHATAKRRPSMPENCIYFFQAEDGIRDIGVTGVSDVCSSDLSALVSAGPVDLEPLQPARPIALESASNNAPTALLRRSPPFESGDIVPLVPEVRESATKRK